MSNNIYYPETYPLDFKIEDYNKETSIVYLTVYSGSLLPQYYIGSTYYYIHLNGYVGSVCSKKYEITFKNELRNNKDLFKCYIISIHNNRRDALDAEYQLHLQYNVVKSDLYMNMANASIDGFIGADAFGNTNVKGRVWVNNGTESKMVYPDSIPEGYILGRDKTICETISKATSNKKRNWKWATCTTTNTCKRFNKDDILPENYIWGRKDSTLKKAFKARVRKYKWFYDPKTNEAIRIYEDQELIEGYLPGRGPEFKKRKSKKAR